MIWKLLTALTVLAVLWLVLFRPGRRRTRAPAAQKLVRCRGCGVYLPAGQACDCADRA